MAIAHPTETRQLLEELCAERILLLDGAMGTMVHALRFDESQFRGKQFAKHSKDLKNFIDILAITQPAAIENIHWQYLEAGADIIETNTFGATSIAMLDFGLEDRVRELNLAAMARCPPRCRSDERAHSRSTALRGRIDRAHEQTAFDRGQRGQCGPSRCDLRSDGRHVLRTGRRAGRAAGVDLLLAETAFDTLVLKACLFAIEKYFIDHQVRLPVMASFTVFEGGRTLGANGRSVLEFDRARRSVQRGNQLRPGAR